MPTTADPARGSARAWVALGSNLGDAQARLLQAISRLQELSLEPLRRSSLWRTTPVDCPAGSPMFVNAVVAFTTLARETPESLLATLQAIETEFGRTRPSTLNAPRTLDLDLIAFGNETRQTPWLTLPHPRAHKRRFVLEPLCEVAPDLVLPGQCSTVSGLLAALNSGEEVWRIGSCGVPH